MAELQTPAPEAAQPSAPAPVSNVTKQNKQKKQQRKKLIKRIISLVLILALVGGAVFGVYKLVFAKPPVQYLEDVVQQGTIQEKLEGYDADRMYCIPLSDVYYAEAVDNRLYIYTEKNVYELKMKLYAFEENYCSGEFFRCSRTAVVNLMRVSYLRPGLNGRLSARLTNGEDIIISSKYVNALKARLQNE